MFPNVATRSELGPMPDAALDAVLDAGGRLGPEFTPWEREALATRNFGLMLRRLRDDRGVSAQRLADAAQVSSGTIRTQENNSACRWGRQTMLAVVRALFAMAPMSEAATSRLLAYANIAHLAGLIVRAGQFDGSARGKQIAELAVDALCSFHESIEIGTDVQRFIDQGADSTGLSGYLRTRNLTNYQAARCVALARLCEVGVAGVRRAVEQQVKAYAQAAAEEVAA